MWTSASKGLSFPLRIGATGGWVTTSVDSVTTQKIRESVLMILATAVGERVMEKTFGSNLNQVIFENLDPTLASVIQYKVTQALATWEPRIQVTSVSVTTDPNTAQVNVAVSYIILSLQVSDQVTQTFGTAT